MSREDPSKFVVSAFRSLEDQLIACMDYIPYIEQNKAVASPKLAPLLMDTCSLIESVFKHTMGDDERRTLKSYASSLEGRLALEDATSLLLISPMRFLRPFAGWTQAAPKWWDAYNRVKHDRILNFEAATLEHTVAALAGLHQVLARSKDFLEHLATAGWFNEADEHFMELLTMHDVGSGPPDMPVETKLYVSPTSGPLGAFVDWDSDPPKIDESWNFSWRVKLFIIEWERI
jgi:hypothetical protein